MNITKNFKKSVAKESGLVTLDFPGRATRRVVATTPNVIKCCGRCNQKCRVRVHRGFLQSIPSLTIVIKDLQFHLQGKCIQKWQIHNFPSGYNTIFLLICVQGGAGAPPIKRTYLFLGTRLSTTERISLKNYFICKISHVLQQIVPIICNV